MFRWVVAGVIVTLPLVTVWYNPRLAVGHVSAGKQRHRFVELHAADMYLRVRYAPDRPSTGFARRQPGWYADFYHELPFPALDRAWLAPPRMGTGGGFLGTYYYVEIPIWYGSGILIAAVWWFGRRKKPVPGRCPSCGYDLSGSGGMVCPECGGSKATP